MRSVGDLGETIPLLAEGEASLRRSAGNVLVAIEDDLSTERGMAGHLDSDVPPVSVPDGGTNND
jgi:hypothetical protein